MGLTKVVEVDEGKECDYLWFTKFCLLCERTRSECGHNFIGFIDDFNGGTEVLGSFEDVIKKYSPSEYEIAIAIGYNNLAARWDVYEKIINQGYEVVSLIHPRAYVSKSAKIGRGTIISVGSVVDFNVQLGEANFIWPGVIINHDSTIGDNSFFSPGVNICRFVHVGSNCFLGASSIIINGNTIEDNSFIKAGTTYYKKG